MRADPKPAPRAPKARKPLPRKRATPRRTRSPRCETRGCRQIARVVVHEILEPDFPVVNRRTGELVTMPPRLWCSKHARREADRLWSLRVRTGRCELREWHRLLGVECGGPIVGFHFFRRGYLSVRWLLWNGASACSGINQWVEDHPLELDEYMRATWGPLYEERRHLALAPAKPDLASVIASLQVPS